MCVVFPSARCGGSRRDAGSRATKSRASAKIPRRKTRGGKTAFAEVILTIFRRDATRTFARRPPNTRVVAPRAGDPGAPEPVIFAVSQRFLLFTPCQSGLLLCAIRAPLAPVSESEPCVIPVRMRVLVACVARTSHTGAPAITSKYVSSWRILARDPRIISPGSPGPLKSPYALKITTILKYGGARPLATRYTVS